MWDELTVSPIPISVRCQRDEGEPGKEGRLAGKCQDSFFCSFPCFDFVDNKFR